LVIPVLSERRFTGYSMKIFFDTNILIYSYDNSNKVKHKTAFDLVSNLLSKEDITISTQVVNEFIVVMTNKVKRPLSIEGVEKIVARFKENFEIRETGIEDIYKAISIYKKHKFSYWDSLIVATAINTNSRILYSEDMQDGQVIENRLRVINPFENRKP